MPRFFAAFFVRNWVAWAPYSSKWRTGRGDLLRTFSLQISSNIRKIFAVTKGSLKRTKAARRIKTDMGTLAKENIIVKRSTRPIKPAPLLPGARSDASGKAVKNVILLSLPDEEYSM